MNLFLVLLLCCVILATLSLVRAEEEAASASTEVAAEKPAPKKKKYGIDRWKELKADNIEKDWEQGDEEAELESEHDRLERIRAQKRPKFDINDKESLKRAYKQDPSTFGTGEGAAGTAMVFVDIKNDPKTGKPRGEQEVRKIASRWTSMLQAGGLLVQLYHPGDSTILFHVERGWLTKEVMKFAAMQKEVATLTLNQKKFTPKEYLRSLEDDDDDL
jgi:hypothetical protein